MAAATVSIKTFLEDLLKYEKLPFQTFIEKGGNVNEEIQMTNQYNNPIFTTPLIYFTEYNRPNIIKMLLEKGADVNKKSYDGFTPLHIAAQYGFDEIVKLLVDNGADVTIKTSEEQTALDLTTSDKIKQLLVSKAKAGGRRRLHRSKRSKSRKHRKNTRKHKSKTRKY
jgi:ankyrin repeat protein